MYIFLILYIYYPKLSFITVVSILCIKQKNNFIYKNLHIKKVAENNKNSEKARNLNLAKVTQIQKKIILLENNSTKMKKKLQH